MRHLFIFGSPPRWVSQCKVLLEDHKCRTDLEDAGSLIASWPRLSTTTTTTRETWQIAGDFVGVPAKSQSQETVGTTTKMTNLPPRPPDANAQGAKPMGWHLSQKDDDYCVSV
jgi:hypothetical protein